MLDLAERRLPSGASLINANFAPIYNTWGLIDVRQGERRRRAPMFQTAPSSSTPRCSRRT